MIDASATNDRVFHVLSGNSTIRNVTVRGGSGDDGGGFLVEGPADLTLENVTVTGNHADGDGGGIANNGMLTLYNVTVAGNAADDNGGGINNDGAWARLYNSVITYNQATVDGADCRGALQILAPSLIANTGSCSLQGTALSGDPGLSAILDGSGNITVYAPTSMTSPVVDTGDAATCLATDQLGTSRPQDGNNDSQAICDLGAYELELALPVAANDGYQTPEDTPLIVDDVSGVLDNDTNALSATLHSGPTSGALTLKADGSFIFTPTLNFNGAATFQYVANGSQGTVSAPATVTIAVTAVNDLPVADNDAYDAVEDQPLTVPAPGVLVGDSDPDGTAVSVANHTQPANGSVSVNADGSFVYTPNRHFDGVDVFTYFAGDGKANSAQPGQVTITVARDAYIEVTTCQDTGTRGSLRWAIEQANQTPGVDTIIFDILDGNCSAPLTILLSSPLPSITEAVLIDGTLRDDGGSQPPGTVTIDGSNAGPDANGFALLAGGVTINGLIIQNFGGNGIVILGDGGNAILNNIVSGNGGHGLLIQDDGTPPASSGGNTVNGNTFAGNGGDGIRIVGSLDDVTGSGGNALGNNAINGNGGNGISILDSANNTLTNNDIHDNQGLSIDLGGDGATPNDLGDGDTGANFVQNYPVLVRGTSNVGVQSAEAAAPAPVTVDGWLNSKPNSQFTLQFFASAACQSGDLTLLNATPYPVVTDAEGNVFFRVTLDVPVEFGTAIKATATDAAGNTSEISGCIRAGFGNDSWPAALNVEATGAPAVVEQYLDQLGQSRWYKFRITPNSKVKVSLSNLPANFDITVYKDILAAYEDLLQPQDLNRLSAEFASDAVAPSALESVGVEPVGVESLGAQPLRFQSVGLQPVGVESLGAEPIGAEPGRH